MVSAHGGLNMTVETLQVTILRAFSYSKYFHSYSNFTEVCSWANIGSCNVLAHQARLRELLMMEFHDMISFVILDKQRRVLNNKLIVLYIYIYIYIYICVCVCERFVLLKKHVSKQKNLSYLFIFKHIFAYALIKPVKNELPVTENGGTLPVFVFFLSYELIIIQIKALVSCILSSKNQNKIN